VCNYGSRKSFRDRQFRFPHCFDKPNGAPAPMAVAILVTGGAFHIADARAWSAPAGRDEGFSFRIEFTEKFRQ
jgi:hypothetical protein